MASTADPEPFLEVPRPIAMDPRRAVPSGPPFSILIVDFALPEGKPLPLPLTPKTAPVVCTERAAPTAASRSRDSLDFVLRWRGRYFVVLGPAPGAHALGGDAAVEPLAAPERDPLALGPIGITSIASSMSSSSSTRLSRLLDEWWNDGDGEREAEAEAG